MEQTFEKKQHLVCGSFGVCVVENVTKLVVGREKQMSYYVLRSLSDKTKKSYIPVEHHETVLRLPLTESQAEELIEDMVKNGISIPEEETLTFSEAKEWLESGDPIKWAKAVDYYYRRRDSLDPQMEEMLGKIWKNLREELAFALKKNQKEIRQIVENGIKC